MSSLRRGHANLLCIVPILVYVLPKWALDFLFWISVILILNFGLPWWLSDKESACNSGDLGLIPGLRTSPGEGNGNPFHYSCLENSMDRGGWWAAVQGVAKIGHNWVTNTFRGSSSFSEGGEPRGRVIGWLAPACLHCGERSLFFAGWSWSWVWRNED